MSSFIPIIDHIVLDVRDRMEEAAAAYRALGFQLTERGYHTLGSVNHLAIFATGLCCTDQQLSPEGLLSDFSVIPSA